MEHGNVHNVYAISVTEKLNASIIKVGVVCMGVDVSRQLSGVCRLKGYEKPFVGVGIHFT